MLVEFIGCTGAGKTTVLGLVQAEARAEGLPHLEAQSLAVRPLSLPRGWSRSTAWAVPLHLGALWSNLGATREQREFLMLTWRALGAANVSPYQRLNQFRKVVKQLGYFRAASRASSDDTLVLLDEGTLHAAHNVFVHAGLDPDFTGVDTFSHSAPLPDICVYVKAPLEVLVDRVLKRGHARISEAGTAPVEAFVGRAVTVFERMMTHSRIFGRTVVVDLGCIDHVGDDISRAHRDLVLRLLENVGESPALGRPKSSLAGLDGDAPTDVAHPG